MLFKKYIIIILLLPIYCFGQNKIKLTSINPQYLPLGIVYKGNPINISRWNDNLGEHYVITSEKESFHNEQSTNEDTNDAELYAYHYIINNKKIITVWEMYDYEKNCDADVYAGYIKNTFQVTDLNNNKIPEIWLMYKTICSNDISPYNLKIIMYEGIKKHTMNGQNKIKISENEYLGDGRFEFDKIFYKSASEFKTFAKELWSKNITSD